MTTGIEDFFEKLQELTEISLSNSVNKSLVGFT
jgi:hypothetical protein